MSPCRASGRASRVFCCSGLFLLGQLSGRRSGLIGNSLLLLQGQILGNARLEILDCRSVIRWLRHAGGERNRARRPAETRRNRQKDSWGRSLLLSIRCSAAALPDQSYSATASSTIFAAAFFTAFSSAPFTTSACLCPVHVDLGFFLNRLETSCTTGAGASFASTAFVTFLDVRSARALARFLSRRRSAGVEAFQSSSKTVTSELTTFALLDDHADLAPLIQFELAHALAAEKCLLAIANDHPRVQPHALEDPRTERCLLRETCPMILTLTPACAALLQVCAGSLCRAISTS